jgi:hypothetical protein
MVKKEQLARGGARTKRAAPLPDDEFLEGCIDEARDGERVTIVTDADKDDVLGALLRLGAKDAELDRMQIVRRGR